MRFGQWFGVALAGVLLAQPALGQGGGGAGAGVPERNPSGRSDGEDSSGAANLNKPAEAGEQGTGSSTEEAADAGTHKSKTKKHKHHATKPSSESSSKKSSQSEHKGAEESGGAQGK